MRLSGSLLATLAETLSNGRVLEIHHFAGALYQANVSAAKLDEGYEPTWIKKPGDCFKIHPDLEVVSDHYHHDKISSIDFHIINNELVIELYLKDGGMTCLTIEEDDLTDITTSPFKSNTQSEVEDTSTTTESKKEDTMSDSTRKLVTVSIIDPSAGIEAADSLIKSLGEHVMDSDEGTLKLQLALDPSIKLAEALASHNEKRSKITDLDILDRTGNEVKLRPLKIEELKWVFK